MKVNNNISVSEKKAAELQAMTKKEAIKWLKETGTFNGISTKLSETLINKAYEQIKSWRIKPAVGAGNVRKNTD